MCTHQERKTSKCRSTLLTLKFRVTTSSTRNATSRNSYENLSDSKIPFLHLGRRPQSSNVAHRSRHTHNLQTPIPTVYGTIKAFKANTDLPEYDSQNDHHRILPRFIPKENTFSFHEKRENCYLTKRG